MKKIFFLLCVSIIFNFQFSIFNSAHAQFSINAAYIHQEHTFNYQNGTLDSLLGHLDYMNGGIIGVTVNRSLLGSIGIAPGAYISFAQAKTVVKDSAWNFTTSNVNVKLPFYLNFKVSLGSKTNLIVFGGPVFNVGLSKLTDFKDVADQVDLHCDMGGTIGAGIQFGAFRFYLGYNVDMIDREDFSLTNKQSVKKAWEGSTLFAGIGIGFGNEE